MGEVLIASKKDSTRKEMENTSLQIFHEKSCLS